MKIYRWDSKKNDRLKERRGISFEEVVLQLNAAEPLDILEHPNKKSYPNQRIFVVLLRGYAYLVPFVEAKDEVFLKTIIPSRKATRDYLAKGETDEDKT